MLSKLFKRKQKKVALVLNAYNMLDIIKDSIANNKIAFVNIFGTQDNMRIQGAPIVKGTYFDPKCSRLEICADGCVYELRLVPHTEPLYITGHIDFEYNGDTDSPVLSICREVTDVVHPMCKRKVEQILISLEDHCGHTLGEFWDVFETWDLQ